MGFNGDLYPTAGASVVMTTKGDMVDYDTERQRLGIGSTGQVLTVASSLPTWATLTTADSVLTTQGDVLYESGSGLARLGFGTSGHVLTTKGTGANPVWEAAGGGGASTANTLLNSGSFSTDSTSFVDVTSMSLTLPTTTAGSDDCLIMFSGVCTIGTLGNAINIIIVDDTTEIVSQDIEPTASGYKENFGMQTITDGSGNTAKLQMRISGGTASSLIHNTDANSVLTAFAV